MALRWFSEPRRRFRRDEATCCSASVRRRRPDILVPHDIHRPGDPPWSSLDDPRDVLKSALGEIERHHEIRRIGMQTRERISRSKSQNLVPHQKLAGAAPAIGPLIARSSLSSGSKSSLLWESQDGHNDTLNSVDQFQSAVIAGPDRLGGLAPAAVRMALAADTRAAAVASLLRITRTSTLSAVLVWLRASERISVSDLAIWAYAFRARRKQIVKGGVRERAG